MLSVNAAPADPAAVPFSSTVTAVDTTTVPVQFAAIGKFVSAQYVRSGQTVNDIDPVADPWPCTVQLALDERVPSTPPDRKATLAPKLPSILETCATLSNATVPRISRFVRLVLALPRLVAIPAAVALDAALQPIRAAQLPPIPSPPLPTAASSTDRAHAGYVPCQSSAQPPEYWAS